MTIAVGRTLNPKLTNQTLGIPLQLGMMEIMQNIGPLSTDDSL